METLTLSSVGARNSIRSLHFANTLKFVAMEKLSTGKAINKAGDDPGRTGILSNLSTKKHAFAGASSAISQSIGLLSIAETALAEATDIVTRLKEITIQSSSSAITATERAALVNEKGLLIEEIYNLSQGTTFNKVKLLDGNFSGKRAQLGISSNDYMQISLASLNPSELGAHGTTGPTRAALTAATGITHADQLNSTEAGNDIIISTRHVSPTIDVTVNESAKSVAAKINALTNQTLVSADAVTFAHLSTTDGSSTTYTLSINGTNTSSFSFSSSDVTAAVAAINLISATTGVTATATTSNQVLLHDSTGEDITIENVAAGTGLRVNAVQRDGSTEVSGTISLQGSGNNDTTRVIGTLRLTSSESFSVTQSGTSSTGYVTTGNAALTPLETLDIDSAATASSSLSTVDAALEQIASILSAVGSFQSRLGFSSEISSSAQETVSQALDNLIGADYAAESAKLAKALLLQRSSAAMLAQSNLTMDLILKLLVDAA